MAEALPSALGVADVSNSGSPVTDISPDGTDQAAAINAALANSTSSVVVLPPGEYLIGSSIIIPDGKSLVGSGQGDTVLKALDGFDLTGGNTAVFLEGNSGLASLTVDVNKVNNGLGLDDRVNGVVASGTDFLVEDVTAINSTGYAFWADGGSAASPASGIFRNCVAENSNILFETNFSDGVLFEGCIGGDGDGDIVCLGVFHPLAGSNNVTFLDCRYEGRAMGIDVLANVGSQTNIVFERVYVETTGPSLGGIIHSHGAFTNDVRFIDTVVIAAVNNGLNVQGSATIAGANARFESPRNALAVFGGSSAHMTDSTAISYDPGYAGANYGLYALGAVVWDGGYLSAIGGYGSAAAYLGRASSVTPSTITETGRTVGNDVFVAQSDRARLIGFDGDDTYYVASAQAVVVEAAEGGNDSIRTSVSYALGAGVNVETLAARAGTDSINLYGNELANLIYGNAGANVLNGGGGADRLIGFGGNDVYYVDDTRNVIVEAAGGGQDIIWTTVSYGLEAGVHVETLSTRAHYGTDSIDLYGNELANLIYGNAGANVLNGGGGADRLIGFGGDDVYYVDDLRDVVVEAAGGGQDIIWTTVSYGLGAGVHVETLSTWAHHGTDGINLSGNELANLIYGNAGANVLNGGGGADRLIGFGGDDVYYVDDPRDVVVEAAGGGQDIIWTTVSYGLGAGVHVETLSTRAHYGKDSINLYGNELANLIYGNAGSNVLNGGGGADRLIGFGGNDVYYVDDTRDVIVEAAGGGQDIIWTTVSYGLGAGVHVETLSTQAHYGTNSINLSGNELANLIYGNAGSNVLNGGGGADRLIGFGGNDVFAFTTTLGAQNVDLIVDFNPGFDRIWLDDESFEGLDEGALPASAFVSGRAAQDAEDRIIYDSSTGQLFFDPDGDGSDAAILFATVQPSLNLTGADFLII